MGELIAALVALVVPVTDRCDALSALDVVRTAAWTTSDEVLLSRIYGPEVGRDDMARLRAWRERGIAVAGARTLRASCRHVGAASVEVVERLGPTVAMLADGSRHTLPSAGWNRRVVTMGRADGTWRILRVGPAD